MVHVRSKLAAGVGLEPTFPISKTGALPVRRSRKLFFDFAKGSPHRAASAGLFRHRQAHFIPAHNQIYDNGFGCFLGA
jgi:hypothetical protein